MERQEVSLKKEDGVALLRIERPKRLNALSRDIVKQIGELLEEIEVDEETRVLLIHSEKHFAAGADIQDMAECNEQEAADPHRGGHRRIRPGRRSGTGAGLRHPLCRRNGENGISGNQPRHYAGSGRNRSGAKTHRRLRGNGIDFQRRDHQRAESLGTGTGKPPGAGSIAV